MRSAMNFSDRRGIRTLAIDVSFGPLKCDLMAARTSTGLQCSALRAGELEWMYFCSARIQSEDHRHHEEQSLPCGGDVRHKHLFGCSMAQTPAVSALFRAEVL